SDDPIDAFDRRPLGPPGTIGEVVVRGPMVASAYFQQPEQDRLHKIGSRPDAWHRMGDCGSIDEDGRLWLVGRKAHRIETAAGTLFPLPAEARANRHPVVRRSALVGVGPRGSQRPVLIVEFNDPSIPAPARATAVAEILELVAQGPATHPIRDVLIHPSL